MPESTIVICGTEPVAIEGLRCLLGAGEGLRVQAAERSLAAGLEAIRELRPDLVVLDKAFGIQPVLETLRTTCPGGTRAIVWGAVSDAEALRFLHAGAAGIVRKTASLETLLECFGAVAAGMNWMGDGLISSIETPVRSSRLPLTSRELQVADLVERGMTNRDIARELDIRIGTVKIHLKHIFEKTGVRGRYGLALCGLKEKGVLLAPAIM